MSLDGLQQLCCAACRTLLRPLEDQACILDHVGLFVRIDVSLMLLQLHKAEVPGSKVLQHQR